MKIMLVKDGPYVPKAVAGDGGDFSLSAAGDPETIGLAAGSHAAEDIQICDVQAHLLTSKR